MYSLKRNFNYEIWLFRMMNFLLKEDFCIYVDNHEKFVIDKEQVENYTKYFNYVGSINEILDNFVFHELYKLSI